MNERTRRDIQQRGELVGSYIRNGMQTQGVGTGISPLAQVGQPRGGSGIDISNLSAIISLEQYERTDEPRIIETLTALEACSRVNQRAALVWLHHYSSDGSVMDKARGIDVGETRYRRFISEAEHMLAARLAG